MCLNGQKYLDMCLHLLILKNYKLNVLIMAQKLMDRQNYYKSPGEEHGGPTRICHYYIFFTFQCLQKKHICVFLSEKV